MICPNCGKENEYGTNFCIACGTKLEQELENNAVVEETPAEAPVEETAEVPDEVIENEPVVQDPVEGENTDPAEEGMFETKKKPAKKLPESGKKLIKTVAIAVAAILALIIVVSFLKSCGSSSVVNVEKYPVIYKTDDELKFMVSGKKEGRTIEENDELASNDYIKITSDGKYIFYAADPDGGEFDLCVRDVSKKDDDANKSIINGISEYKITPDGSTIIYVKNNDLYKCSRNGKKSIKLGKDVVSYDINEDLSAVVYVNDDGEAFYSTGVDKIHNEINDKNASVNFSGNGKNILIVERKMDEETYEDLITLSICGTGKKDKPEKLESNINSYVFTENEEYSSFYFVKKGKLYLKNGKKDAVAIEGFDGDVMSVLAKLDNEGNKHIYATTVKEKEDFENECNFYYVDGKKVKLLLEDFGQMENGTSKIIETSKYDREEYTTKETYYLRADFDNLVEIELPKDDDDNTVQYYVTEKYVYTIEDVSDKGTGDLVQYEIKSKGIDFSGGKVIAEDVYDISVLYTEFLGGETVIIRHDYDEYSVYNGTKSVEIDADVHNFLWFSNDGTMFIGVDYNDNKHTYTLAKFDGKKVINVAEDVIEAAIIDENLIYYINEDDELVVNKGKLGKDTVIDEDTTDIINPRSHIVTEKDQAFDSIIPSKLFW